jgi:2-pyrone-4,6-dicarboxylate lactonase
MHRRDVLAAMASLGLTNVIGSRIAQAADEPAIPAIAGPDLNTIPPKFRAPAGSVDTHTHIFGPAAVYPFSPKRPYSPPDAPA